MKGDGHTCAIACFVAKLSPCGVKGLKLLGSEDEAKLISAACVATFEVKKARLGERELEHPLSAKQISSNTTVEKPALAFPRFIASELPSLL